MTYGLHLKKFCSLLVKGTFPLAKAGTLAEGRTWEEDRMAINFAMIGRQIKEKRRARRITQAHLAEMIDMSVSYISYIERAKKRASLESLVRIATALGTTVDCLLSYNQRNTPEALTSHWVEVLSDCSNEENVILYETVCALKASIRRNCLEKGELF